MMHLGYAGENVSRKVMSRSHVPTDGNVICKIPGKFVEKVRPMGPSAIFVD